ncbi:hypothetical protein [Lactobacillus brevis] [Lactiplantibacillus mudanjiangensis]|nr:hypothetical protein [Lactobacillus brevis] [Lactiplantibacillus mudanjiangensis]
MLGCLLIMTKEIYPEVLSRLGNIQLFKTVPLTIVIEPVVYDFDDDVQELATYVNQSPLGYLIETLKCDIPKELANVAPFDRLKKIVDDIKQRLLDREWNIFYLYKELIQQLVQSEDDVNFNYFRGQFDKWPLEPSLFRTDTKQKFQQNYDNIYSNIAKEYPDKIKYIPYTKERAGERAEQLAMLQHYGMRTSLLDITKNPFIAMQFMSLGKISNSPHINTLDMYYIDEERHAENNIFVSVIKSNLNKRIKAQKGAFFDFDYLFDLKETSIEKIPRLNIVIDYDLNKFLAPLKKEQAKFSDFQQVIKAKIDQLDDTKDKKQINELRNLNDQVGLAEHQIEELLKEAPTTLKTKLANRINSDIKTKLTEYFYLEKNLFPDFDRYISYVQSQNIEHREKLNK